MQRLTKSKTFIYYAYIHHIAQPAHNVKEENIMNETQHNNINRIGYIQKQANAHGLALAMSEPPVSSYQIIRTGFALDDIIDNIDKEV